MVQSVSMFGVLLWSFVCSVPLSAVETIINNSHQTISVSGNVINTGDQAELDLTSPIDILNADGSETLISGVTFSDNDFLSVQYNVDSGQMEVSSGIDQNAAEAGLASYMFVNQLPVRLALKVGLAPEVIVGPSKPVVLRMSSSTSSDAQVQVRYNSLFMLNSTVGDFATSFCY